MGEPVPGWRPPVALLAALAIYGSAVLAAWDMWGIAALVVAWLVLPTVGFILYVTWDRLVWWAQGVWEGTEFSWAAVGVGLVACGIALIVGWAMIEIAYWSSP